MPPRFGGLPPGCDVQSRVPIAGLAGGTRATSILRPPLSSRRTTGGVLGARSERRVSVPVVGRASYTASADTTIGFLDRRVAIPTGPFGIPLAWSRCRKRNCRCCSSENPEETPAGVTIALSVVCTIKETPMSRKVADVLWEMLVKAGVKRCYGIVGDALNPVVDALRRNGTVEFVPVRHEEYGVLAAVAEAYFTGSPVVVCGTAGPGVVHLFNGLMDARKEGAPVIAIAGDVETSIMDTSTLEELNPYKFFEAASLYTARLVNPEQARSVFNTAILTAVLEKGPTVLSIPGDVASADAPDQPTDLTLPAPAILRPSDTDLDKLVRMIDEAKTVAIFGGDGC